MSRLRQRRSSSRHDGNDKRHAQAANVAAASTPRVSSAISDPAAYENIDPSRFCVALADYDPPTIYRLWLG